MNAIARYSGHDGYLATKIAEQAHRYGAGPARIFEPGDRMPIFEAVQATAGELGDASAVLAHLLMLPGSANYNPTGPEPDLRNDGVVSLVMGFVWLRGGTVEDSNTALREVLAQAPASERIPQSGCTTPTEARRLRTLPRATQTAVAVGEIVPALGTWVQVEALVRKLGPREPAVRESVEVFNRFLRS